MRDFEILKAARKSTAHSGSVEGYIVKYEGDLYFIYNPDDGLTIDDCELWSHDIESRWCIDEYDPDDRYYEIEGILRPLSLDV